MHLGQGPLCFLCHYIRDYYSECLDSFCTGLIQNLVEVPPPGAQFVSSSSVSWGVSWGGSSCLSGCEGGIKTFASIIDSSIASPAVHSIHESKRDVTRVCVSPFNWRRPTTVEDQRCSCCSPDWCILLFHMFRPGA